MNSNSKNIKMNKILWIALIMITFAFCTYLFTERYESDEASASAVAMVNGNQISVQEFTRSLNNNKPSVVSYFKSKYGIEAGENFWNSNRSGEVPRDVLLKKALDEAVRIKIQQQLAKEKGLVKDISYSAFLAELNKENQRRTEDLSKGRPVFGPKQYQENQYFDYVFSNQIIKLKEKLGEKELKTSEDNLKKYYEAHLDLFKKGEIIKVAEVLLPADNKANPIIISDVQIRLSKGESPEAIVSDYKKQGVPDLKYGEVTYDSKKISESEDLNELQSAILNLKAGQVSNVILQDNIFVVVKNIDRKGDGYKPFADVKELVTSLLLDDEYKKLIDSRVEKAKIKANSEYLESVVIH